MEKTTLLENIQREHNQLVTLLTPLDEVLLCTSTLDGGWSIKDLMAHVSAWEQLDIKHLHFVFSNTRCRCFLLTALTVNLVYFCLQWLTQVNTQTYSHAPILT